ncbi:hypothetical protein Ahy_A03g014086 [Arachis hypogaea]|uniref:Uncharacterized protein n=1 Tax=Arachis hypogaea TaxID=3818 RepID=A0A445DWX6_ARAHY|nr:hypothetical protein Ahy_A03g014086 [Arachis hypogaea]
MISHECSSRITPQKANQVQRSTKKVKPQEDMNLNQPGDKVDMVLKHHNEVVSIPKSSCKDFLLKPVGPEIDKIAYYDKDIDEATPNPEDKWYKKVEANVEEEKPFNPCPVINRPFFLSSEQVVRKIVAWICILYNYCFLWRIGSVIGTILKIDKTTSIHSRGRFARICVEIDLAMKLVPKISVMGAS